MSAAESQVGIEQSEMSKATWVGQGLSVTLRAIGQMRPWAWGEARGKVL